MKIHLRPEKPADRRAILEMTQAAFSEKSFSCGTEAPIIDQLRDDGDLSLSLIAMVGDELSGHVAFSPALIGDASDGW